MADKIIKLRIDVKKIVKDYLFKGEKGTYLDATVLYNDEPDGYGSNGMIVQDIPKDIYEKEKNLPKEQRTRGTILGNCKNWATQERDNESIPGSENSTKKSAAGAAPVEDVADDLPF